MKMGVVMTILNFECKKCHQYFDANVGKVTFDENERRPKFSKTIVCGRGTAPIRLNLQDKEFREYSI